LNLTAKVIVGDNRQTLKQLPDKSVQTVITSPPYWGLRDYGNDAQIGHEPTPSEFVEELCQVFDEVWRVLKDDGTLWVNLGDSYLNKSLAGVPWRFAFAMQDRGWFLRQDIIWAKPNPMPESVTDRCTKSHEYIFLLTKSPKYYFDHEAIKEDSIWSEDKRAGSGRLTYDGKRQGKEGEGQEAFVAITDKRNKRDVWNVAVKPYAEAHFATYPAELITPCVLAGSAEGDFILDPFSGSGTTGEVALNHGRNYIGLELNPDYADLSEKRLTQVAGMFGEVEIVK